MMASGYSDYSQLSSKPCMCWTIREGYVQMIENHVPITRYLKAKCGIIDGWPARLECYKDIKSANEEKSMMWRIHFTDVEIVDKIERRQRAVVIIIRMQKGNKMLFYTDSDTSTKKWYNYCSLLFKIPKYAIPRESVTLQQEEFHSNDLHDADNKWVVYTLNKGIGCTKRIHGICTVYICNSSSTFNLYDFHGDKRLLCWNRDDIGLSGCINSLVFVEIKETWREEHAGLLWMREPTRQSAALQKQIHNFLYARPEERNTPSPIPYVFVDSAMSHAHIRDDIELSQTPYDDQLSDTSSSSLNTPVSQNASLSSESSQLSSGYYSDSSYGDSISSKGSQLSCPKVTPKCTPGKAEKDSPVSKKPAAVSSPPIHATSLTMKHSDSSQNASIQREMSPTPNTHRKLASLQHHPVIQPHVHSSSAKETKIPKPPRSTFSQSTPNSSAYSSSVKAPIPNPSSKKVTNTTTIAKSTWRNPQLARNAFQECSVIMVRNLDLTEIIPQLNSKGMLTKEDNEILENDYFTRTKKIRYLLDVLPRKKATFLDDFMYCLGTTTDGTGHADIAEALSASYNEEVRKADTASGCTSANKAPKNRSKK